MEILYIAHISAQAPDIPLTHHSAVETWRHNIAASAEMSFLWNWLIVVVSVRALLLYSP